MPSLIEALCCNSKLGRNVFLGQPLAKRILAWRSDFLLVTIIATRSSIEDPVAIIVSRPQAQADINVCLDLWARLRRINSDTTDFALLFVISEHIVALKSGFGCSKGISQYPSTFLLVLELRER